MHFNSNIQKACRAAALFLKVGKWLWHFPQPRFQAVGLARWSVKLKNQRVSTWFESLGMTMTLGTCPERGTCPLLKHTCVSLRVVDEKNEWVGKEKQSFQRGGNKWQHPKDATYLRHMSPDNACHLYCCVTWPAGAENAQEINFWKTGSCFCLSTKTHYGPEQIIVYHVHETTLSVLWAYVSCQCKTHAHFNSNIQKACRAAALFLKWGNGCDTSHSRAFSPV